MVISPCSCLTGGSQYCRKREDNEGDLTHSLFTALATIRTHQSVKIHLDTFVFSKNRCEKPLSSYINNKKLFAKLKQKKKET
jgi:hypothetical protein